MFFLLFSDKKECTLFSNICENGGNCIEMEGSYRCDCSKGWTGKHCGIGKSDVNKMNQGFFFIESLLQNFI